MNELFIEDWEFEAEKDEIYLEEARKDRDTAYWEWYEKTEGKIIIENSDGTTTEVDEMLREYKLPF